MESILTVVSSEASEPTPTDSSQEQLTWSMPEDNAGRTDTSGPESRDGSMKSSTGSVGMISQSGTGSLCFTEPSDHRVQNPVTRRTFPGSIVVVVCRPRSILNLSNGGGATTKLPRTASHPTNRNSNAMGRS